MLLFDKKKIQLLLQYNSVVPSENFNKKMIIFYMIYYIDLQNIFILITMQ